MDSPRSIQEHHTKCITALQLLLREIYAAPESEDHAILADALASQRDELVIWAGKVGLEHTDFEVRLRGQNDLLGVLSGLYRDLSLALKFKTVRTLPELLVEVREVTKHVFALETCVRDPMAVEKVPDDVTQSVAEVGSAETEENTYKNLFQDIRRSLLSPTDIFIAVLGVPSSGKTSFISKLCPAAAKHIRQPSQTPSTNHSLYSFHYRTYNIHLLDTPDTYFTSILGAPRLYARAKLLHDFSYYLSKAHAAQIPLSGIIFTYYDMPKDFGASDRDQRQVVSIAGPTTQNTVCLCTKPTSPRRARFVEETAVEKFTSQGALFKVFDGSVTSALRVIDFLVTRAVANGSPSNPKPSVSAGEAGLQQEICSLRKPLNRTRAGCEVAAGVSTRLARIEERSQELETQFTDALGYGEPELVQSLSREVAAARAERKQLLESLDLLDGVAAEIVVEREEGVDLKMLKGAIERFAADEHDLSAERDREVTAEMERLGFSATAKELVTYVRQQRRFAVEELPTQKIRRQPFRSSSLESTAAIIALAASLECSVM